VGALGRGRRVFGEGRLGSGLVEKRSGASGKWEGNKVRWVAWVPCRRGKPVESWDWSGFPGEEAAVREGRVLRRWDGVHGTEE